MSETANLQTIRDWLRYAVSRFRSAGLFFGHGMQNAYDEAAYLILHTLHLPLDRIEPFLDAHLTPPECEALNAVLRRRIEERIPASYLTGEAWLGDYRFYVDERVIVPRSYFAELLDESLTPWIKDPEAVTDALDLCTGSGCLAIVMAHAFPNAHIDATDLSLEALEVAQRNISEYGLEGRVKTIHSDLFANVHDRQYDLIISNPPYVTEAAMRQLPPEYRHEPKPALAGGADGLDVVRCILGSASHHLKPNGILAVEIGHNRAIVEAAFPELELTWLATSSGEDKIFMLGQDGLASILL